MNFSNWLIKARKEAGLTQLDLAKKAKVSRSYIGHLENMRPHSTSNALPKPNREKVVSIAKALNADVDLALSLAGFASNIIPLPIVEEGFEGLSENDIHEIVEFIRFRKFRKK
jgi:transcriptional regulator with XRE-family HTH domain